MTLLGVRGMLTGSNVGSVRQAFDSIADGAAVHLDLSQANFADEQVVRIIELAVDQLELRHVKIRIVGLDPLHPALAHARRR
jgi:anti-anti-sigma regulatory factor